MNSALVSFGSLLLAFASLLLKAAFKILIFMFVLWLVGTLWPYVADALGMPYGTVYDFYLSIIASLKDLNQNLKSVQPVPTPTPVILS
jgi:hypothetical protein